MTMSMYAASIPVFQHMLRNLAFILEKGEANAQARGFDPAALTTYRLAPDMLPFTRQVLIACDAAKLCAARISGVEAPKFEDNEATFADLRARVQKTLAYLETVPASAIDGSEDRQITIPVGREKTRTMSAQAYLTTWALPNFFFHITMTYAILRHNGVDLGKADYLAGAAGR
ncbi:DUF1993 domain-containing protein [Ramlibacter alkalitolerans]|uniref:DUF1993 domain-containing protein n=1 Tax=Ramlibacter alkalitolerans TaxID=2039631 RepID=A0ABS1JKM2_9BURK|nr:DUF1993 domain-containing protein [Ramlibacter alkalitolerans]MBL0424783.1 DUF1993 domain-containing protein [Ramlibacter alkalitolerans]